MALSNCAKLLNNYLKKNNFNIPEGDVADLRTAVEQKKLDLEKQGKTFDSFIPGSASIREKDAFFADLIQEYFNDLSVEPQSEKVSRFLLYKYIAELEGNSEYLKKFYPKAPKSVRDIKAYKASIFKTGDTFGLQPVEAVLDSELKIMSAAFFQRVRELTNAEDPFELLRSNNVIGKTKDIDFVTGQEIERDLKFGEAVLLELFNFISILRSKTGQKLSSAMTESITGNKEVHQVARAYMETVIAPTFYHQKSYGKNVGIVDNAPKITIKKYRVQELQQAWLEKQKQDKRSNFDASKVTGDEAFVTLLSENMSSNHGSPTERQTLARKIYNKFMQSMDWRDADTIVRQHKEQVVGSLPEASAEKGSAQFRLPNVLEFKDGKAWKRVNDLIGGHVAFTEVIHRGITESSKEIGMTKKFGPDYATTFARLKKAVETGQLIDDPLDYSGTFNIQDYKTGNFFDKKYAKAANEYVEHLMNPWIGENIDTSVWTSILGVARNLQVFKLGSGLITQIADLGSFWTVARNRIQSKNSVLKSLTGFDFKGTKAERKMFASAFVDMNEVLVADLHDRFRLIDHGGMGGVSKIGDKAVKGSSWLAGAVLKMTWFTQWNRVASIGATSFVTRDIGDLIKSKTAWEKLQPEQKYNFQKYGFNEYEYNSLLSAGDNALDPSGRFNIFGYQVFIRENKNLYNNNEVRKMINIVNDLAETMIIKPSAIDQATVGFFSRPGTVKNQAFRAFSQFKTFLVAHSRKLLMQQYRTMNQQIKNKQFVDLIVNGAHLFVPIMILSYSVVQLKQIIAGKNPYTDLGTVVNEMMQYTNIIPFIGDMYWQNGGEDLYKIATLKDGEKTPRSGISVVDFLKYFAGPTVQDFESFTRAFLELGSAGVLQIKGRDRDAASIFKQSVSRFSRTFQGLDPFANMWMTKAVWRSLTYDAFLEYFDPIRYNRAKRRLERRAMDERANGELYNWVFKDLGLAD